MKFTIITVFFSLSTVILVFFAMIYPSWFQQRLVLKPNAKNSNSSGTKEIFQRFGIWVFYSDGELLGDPIYASNTVMKFSSICDIPENAKFPNWMLSSGEQFKKVLCGSSVTAVQTITVISAVFSVIILIASVVAVYFPSAGYAERIVSWLTFFGALLLSASLIVWGWLIQQRLYEVDTIHNHYSECKSSSLDWSCWFYGSSFWVALSGVLTMSVAGYFSSLGRSEKIKLYRKHYETDMQAAIQASVQQQQQQQQLPVQQTQPIYDQGTYMNLSTPDQANSSHHQHIQPIDRSNSQEHNKRPGYGMIV